MNGLNKPAIARRLLQIFAAAFLVFIVSAIAIDLIFGGHPEALLEPKFLASGLIALVLSSLLVSRLFQLFSKPFQEIGEKVLSIAEGNLDVRIDVVSDDEIGKISRSINELADQLKKAINELNDHKNRANTILASMTDGIIVTDEEGVIQVFNQACTRIFKREASEVIGTLLRQADLHPLIAAMVEESITEGTVCRREIRLPGREETIVDATTSPLKCENGKIIGCILALFDLTEIRTQEKVQRDFVANASHELRTPITSIRVTAEALMSGAKEDPGHLDRFLRTIINESERLSALIEDLLEIAKRDAGRKTLERSKVSLVKLSERSCEYWRTKAESKKISLECGLKEEIFLDADESQMEQVLNNLISNAIKYTPEGGKVTLSAFEKDRWAAISVTDTGIGIPQGDLARIFDRFYRVDKNRSRQMGGTGLGLSIVKDIVESHGGIVLVDSELGKGSTFTVTIPKWME